MVPVADQLAWADKLGVLYCVESVSALRSNRPALPEGVFSVWCLFILLSPSTRERRLDGDILQVAVPDSFRSSGAEALPRLHFYVSSFFWKVFRTGQRRFSIVKVRTIENGAWLPTPSPDNPTWRCQR